MKIRAWAKLIEISNFCLLFILASISCKSQPKSLTGKYVSVIPKISFENYTVGNTLILNVDSTFNFETCSELIYGKWKINNKQDSLLLFFTKYRYKNDSLNKIPVKGWDKTLPSEKFKILSSGYLIKKLNYGYHKLKKVS